MIKTNFTTFDKLSKEVYKREFRNIAGLSAKISNRDYYRMLEAVPPFYIANGFINTECLTDNLYYFFFTFETIRYCVVIDRFKLIDATNKAQARKQEVNGTLALEVYS